MVRMRRNGNACALLVGMYNGAVALEKSKKFYIELPYDPADPPTQGIYPRELKK